MPLTLAHVGQILTHSQGSVATPFRCGGNCNDHFVANYLASLPAKEFWRSANAWRRYGQEFRVMFFFTHGVGLYRDRQTGDFLSAARIVVNGHHMFPHNALTSSSSSSRSRCGTKSLSDGRVPRSLFINYSSTWVLVLVAVGCLDGARVL